MSPLLRLRIVRRRLVLEWRESEYLMVLARLGTLAIALIVWIVIQVMRAGRQLQ